MRNKKSEVRNTFLCASSSMEERRDSDVLGLAGVVIAPSANFQVAVDAPFGAIRVTHEPVLGFFTCFISLLTITDD